VYIFKQVGESSEKERRAFHEGTLKREDKDLLAVGKMIWS